MKILIITMQLSDPPASGGAIRVLGVIKGLHEAGHQVSLMAFATDEEKQQAVRLSALCETIITVPPPQPRSKTRRLRDLLLTRQPDIAFRFYDPAFEQRLRQLLAEQQFDLIQIEAIEAACYLPIAIAASPAAKIVFDTFNAEYVLQRVIADIDRRELKRLPAALYSWIQSRRIRRYEAEMCRLSDAVIAVSPEDADALRIFRVDGKISIVPSGIIVQDYAKQVDETRDRDNLPSNRLVFTGKMDYRPNVDAMLWFAEDILPLIRHQLPNIQVDIVGQQPHTRLQRLTEDNRIQLTGRVESVIPYLQAAGVYIAPLRMGSGTRLKLLEAMACGCAIVATSTAAAGLLPEVKASMRIADDPAGFAAQVIDLLQHPEQRDTLGTEAQRQVRAHYDWSVLIPMLLNAYREIGLVL
jgi:glycosyltransferase involved in cell wall biosynthesis